MSKIKSQWPNAVTQQDAAKLFRVTAPSLSKWIGLEGAPCLPDKRVNLSDLMSWRINQIASREKGTTANQQKTLAEIEKLNLEIQKREIELEQQRNESILRSDHERILTDYAVHFRRALEHVCLEFASKLVGLPGLDVARMRSKELSNSVLRMITGQKTDTENEKKTKKKSLSTHPAGDPGIDGSAAASPEPMGDATHP
jgi:hypothetical protein